MTMDVIEISQYELVFINILNIVIKYLLQFQVDLFKFLAKGA